MIKPLSGKPIAYVYTVDRDRALGFYRDTLGLALQSSDDYGDELDLGASLLRLTVIKDHRPSEHPVLGWAVEELDQFVIHQVSKAHTQAFLRAFRIDPKKVMTIFGEHGNIGPASVPIVLSKLREMGRLKKGNRIALLGIGSGLNCSMAEVVW